MHACIINVGRSSPHSAFAKKKMVDEQEEWSAYTHPVTRGPVLAAHMAPDVFQPASMNRLERIGTHIGVGRVGSRTAESQIASGRTLTDTHTDPRTGITYQYWADAVQDREILLEGDDDDSRRGAAHPRLAQLTGAREYEEVARRGDVYAPPNPRNGDSVRYAYDDVVRQRVENAQRASGFAPDARVPEVRDGAIDPNIRINPFLEPRPFVNVSGADLAGTQVGAQPVFGRDYVSGDDVLPPVLGGHTVVAQYAAPPAAQGGLLAEVGARLSRMLWGGRSSNNSNSRYQDDTVGEVVIGAAAPSFGQGGQGAAADPRYGAVGNLRTRIMPPTVNRADVLAPHAHQQHTNAIRASQQRVDEGARMPFADSMLPPMPPVAPVTYNVRANRSGTQGASAMRTPAVNARAPEQQDPSGSLRTQVQANNVMPPSYRQISASARVPEYTQNSSRVQMSTMAANGASIAQYNTSEHGEREDSEVEVTREAVLGRVRRVGLPGSVVDVGSAMHGDDMHIGTRLTHAPRLNSGYNALQGGQNGYVANEGMEYDHAALREQTNRGYTSNY
jgi:hypothetical protein